MWLWLWLVVLRGLGGRLAADSPLLLLDMDAPIDTCARLLAGCGLQKMQLSFRHCTGFDADAMGLIAEHLPHTLEELDLANGGLDKRHAEALAIGLEKRLARLEEKGLISVHPYLKQGHGQ